MKSKKFFLITTLSLVIFSLTACTNNTTDPSIANQNNSTATNQTDAKKLTNTAQVGGLKIEGTVDTESLKKNSKVISSTSNPSSTSGSNIAGKKGLLINSKGFNSKELDVPLGYDLIIYNDQGNEIQIASSSQNCSEFNPGFSLKNKETKTITFKEEKVCEIYLNSNPELKATIIIVK